MKFYGKAEEVAQSIVNVFESGQLPQALSDVFIRRSDDAPCRKWSWSNQLITALVGRTSDARGFRQWEEVGRHVLKGSKAFHILAPCMAKVTDKETGETGQRIVGFRTVPVFALESTDGKPLAGLDGEAQKFLDTLPLRPVAESWGISVQSFDGTRARYRGYYRGGERRAIALGVQNLSTWAHELVHAAEDRLGKLTVQGQDTAQEIVAELGGAVLLECMGFSVEADKGGCWEYVRSYAEREKKHTVSVCTQLLNRVCNAVNLILETAEQLSSHDHTPEPERSQDVTQPAEEALLLAA